MHEFEEDPEGSLTTFGLEAYQADSYRMAGDRLKRSSMI